MPRDLVATVCTSERAKCAHDFTTDRSDLRAVIGEFESDKTRFDGEASIHGRPLLGANLGKAFGQLDTLRTLTSVAKRLGGVVDRRKALIYPGEGVDADLAHPSPVSAPAFRFDEACVDQANRLVDEARRANVALYLLDPRGVTRYQEEGLVRQADSEQGDFEPWLDRARVAREGLVWLADQTGGFAAVNTTRFDEAVDRIVRDTGTYYLLAYAPSNQRTDGRYRAITVDVTRPGLRVRARRGYFASPRPADPHGGSPRATARLNDAIAGLLPSTDLRMRLSSAVFKPSAGRKCPVLVAVAVEYPQGADEVPLPPDDVLEFHLQATDMEGRVRGTDRRAVRALQTPSANAQEGPTGGWQIIRAQVLLRVNLAPGRYALRVAGLSTRCEKAGSVFATVDVPAFDRMPVSMSSMVVGRSAGLPADSGGSNRASSLTPVLPTTGRDFGQGDELLAFVRVYLRSGHRRRVTIETTLTATDGRVTFRRTGEKRAADETAPIQTVDHLVRIPLERVERGTYSLAITCRDGEQGTIVAAGETTVRVRE